MKRHFRGLGWAGLSVGFVAFATLVGGCNAPQDEAAHRDEASEHVDFETVAHALTSEQARVLGFETPTADWASNVGTLASSANAIEGNSALAVTPNGWTEVNSIPLSTLANVVDTLSYDIYLPEVPGWGETRAILVSPTLEMWWSELGRQELTELPGAQYSTVSFPLSPEQVAALSTNYSDLTIKLVINAPALAQPYLLDNAVVTNNPEPDPPPTGEIESFTVLVPTGVSSEQTFLSATDHLSILSQAHAGLSGEVPAIANFGIFTTYLQAEAHAYADIYSVGPVQLDVKTRVGGSITSEGVIGKQGLGTADAPIVDGTESSPAPVSSEPISWSVAWPSVIGPDVNLPAAPTQDPVLTTLVPGAYGDFNVHSRNHVLLSSGTYFFDTFNTEPEAELHLDSSAGVVVVYVKDNLPWGTGIGSKAPIFTDSGDDAQLLLGFLGSGDVFIQGSFQGTVVAPEALIKVERPSNPGLPEPAPSHQGAFFGKSVEIAAGQHTVIHTPINGGLPLVTPIVCINSVGDGTLSARFGYKSLGILTIPVGPNNRLDPPPLEVLGQTVEFQAGDVEGAFRATFPANGTLSWTVFGRAVTADANSPFCPLPPPQPEDPNPPLADGPRGHSSKVGPLQPYFVGAPHSFFSLNFDDPDGNVPDLSALVTPPVPVPVPLPAAAGDTVTLTLTPTAAGFSSGFTMVMGLWFTFSDVFSTEFELTATGPNVGATQDYGQAELFHLNGSTTQTWLDWQWTRTASLASLQQHQIDVVYFNGGGMGSSGEIPSNGSFGIDAETLFVLPDETGVMAIDCENGGTLQLNPPLGCAQTGTDCCRIRELHGDMYADFRFDITCDIATTLPCSTDLGPGLRACNPDGVGQCVPLLDDSRLCVQWNTDYIDENLGESVTGPHPASFAEYFLALNSPGTSGTHVVGLNRDPATGEVIQGSGPAEFLDPDGCIPASKLPPELLVHKPGDPQNDLTLELRVRSYVATPLGQTQFNVKYDPDTTSPSDITDGHIDSMDYLCLRITQDAISLADWAVDSNGFVYPPETVTLQNPTLHELTNVAATIGRIMTTPDLDIKLGSYDVIVGTGFPSDLLPVTPPAACTTNADCDGELDALCTPPAVGQQNGTCGCADDTDCRGERTCLAINSQTNVGRCGVVTIDSHADPDADRLYIGPANLGLDSESCVTGGTSCAEPGQACLQKDGSECPPNTTCQCRWVDQSRWKFTAAHEAAHMLQRAAIGRVYSGDYVWRCDVSGGCTGTTVPPSEILFDPPFANSRCTCDQIGSANRFHCLQSLERMAEAEGEGFAHFFASRVWNDVTNPDACTFNYYKEGLLDACPDANNLDCLPFPGGGVRVLPPFPMDCAAADKWRNTRCGGIPNTNDTTLAEMGTERDWTQFLWNWNRRGPNNTTMTEMFEAYRQICNPGQCINEMGARIGGCSLSICPQIEGTYVDNLRLRFTWSTPVPPSPLTSNPSEDAIAAFENAVTNFERSRSYEDGVTAYYNALIAGGEPVAQDRLDHFDDMADQHGVDENTSP